MKKMNEKLKEKKDELKERKLKVLIWETKVERAKKKKDLI